MNTDTCNRPSMATAGLNFYRFGYFVRPLVAGDGASKHWWIMQDLIGRLQCGDFSADHELLQLSQKTQDWPLRNVATRVLGHAATVACFRTMRAELEDLSNRPDLNIDVGTRELMLLYARTFAGWGRLDVVPVLMDQYVTLRLKRIPEISVLPLLLAELLSADPATMIAHEPPEEQLEGYLNLVMDHYDALKRKLGSDKAHVFRGDLISARALAAAMQNMTSAYVASELHSLRQRFEPTTGVDCSDVFLGPEVRADVAQTIASNFLQSAAAAKFVAGERYFFGHRVPA